ncbi:CLUMA_CG000317, isoform A [Clunio marinus]|uniref:CLUMA_CG000317, isoform A n=1 Tax=Clunio marinus TaxID=568069 RepID=A0A1J1HIX3_9DIPT|nr:CLUMA_CG000317, isoform A [Clunio marinus]
MANPYTTQKKTQRKYGQKEKKEEEKKKDYLAFMFITNIMVWKVSLPTHSCRAHTVDKTETRKLF